jgi:hypothetical protein
MPIDKIKKSNRLLASRRYTQETFNDNQEAFTSVLDINASEIFIQQKAIPTSSLPYSGSSQNELFVTSGSENILKYYYEFTLTPSSTTNGSNTEVYFFISRSGHNPAVAVDAQLIQDGQQGNFISPKYSSASLANSTTEDATPGYNVVVKNNGAIASPGSYQFDYKNGVLQFSSSAPTTGNTVKISTYQYVGKTLDSFITSGSGGGTGTGFPFSGSATITGSLLISSSGLTITGSGINILSGSINITNGGITSSLFGTASWANNATNATNAQTASYVNPLTQSVIISGGFEAIGISGSRAYLGTHIVGTSTLGVTGSGLIISSSNLPSNHHNFVKIGNTELVDQNIIGVQNRFFINNVDELYIRSGGLSDGGDLTNNILLKHVNGAFTVGGVNNSSPLIVSSASLNVTAPSTFIRAQENSSTLHILSFASDPAGVTPSLIGFTRTSKFIFTTGSTAGQIISGSGSLPALIISGGLSVNGGITGSLLGTASFVVSASHALTASFINPTQFIIPEMGITGSGLIVSASQSSGVANGIKIGNHEVLDLVNTFRINVNGSNTNPTALSDFIITSNNNAVTGSIVNFSQNYFAFTERPGPSGVLQGYYNFRANSTDFVVYKSESLNTDATIAFDVNRVTGKLYASGGADLSGSTNIQNDLAVGGTLSAGGASTLNSLTVTNLTTLNGNLVVNGTASFFGSASFVNVDNLLVEDKFILLNSGALGSPANEGGIIVQTTSSAGVAAGTALFYDQTTNRWMAARSSSVDFNATSIAIGATTDYVVTVSASAGAPSSGSTPLNFGTTNHYYGQMYIQTDTSDIYIYA